MLIVMWVGKWSAPREEDELRLLLKFFKSLISTRRLIKPVVVIFIICSLVSSPLFRQQLFLLLPNVICKKTLENVKLYIQLKVVLFWFASFSFFTHSSPTIVLINDLKIITADPFMLKAPCYLFIPQPALWWINDPIRLFRSARSPESITKVNYA